MNAYQQSIDYLLSFTNLELKPGQSLTKKDFSLENITILLEKLDNPQNDFKSIHIAGSKGKGSTSAIIESCLRTSGKKTGLFTSPHLIDYPERFRIDGVPVSRSELTKTIEFLKPFISDTPGIQTFEIMTAIAFKIFSDQKIDVAVVEVGLGGRLDSTNVLEPIVSVITPIFLEHTYVLGDTIRQIAIEKAGIIKKHVPAVISHQPQQEATKVFENIAKKVNSQIIYADQKTHMKFDSYTEHKMIIIWKRKEKDIKLSTALLGKHQIQNMQTAITILVELGVSQNDIVSGIKNVVWPARFDVRKVGRKTYIFDASHIKESMVALVDTYNQIFKNKATVIFGSSNDKDIEGILRILKPIIDTLIITQSFHPRAASVSQIVKLADKLKIPYLKRSKLSSAVESAKDGKTPILITGSFFVVGEAMEELGIKI